MVLDCSVTMAWLFMDEANKRTDALLTLAIEQGALVPNLWHLEVANVLTQAQRRGRISTAQSAERVALLEQLPIVVDPETSGRGLREVLAIATDYQLSSYDAAYLELAMRHALPLATVDKTLAKAARKAGTQVLPPAHNK
jgi:predicted nucleic acid-binding protein